MHIWVAQAGCLWVSKYKKPTDRIIATFGWRKRIFKQSAYPKFNYWFETVRHKSKTKANSFSNLWLTSDQKQRIGFITLVQQVVSVQKNWKQIRWFVKHQSLCFRVFFSIIQAHREKRLADFLVSGKLPFYNLKSGLLRLNGRSEGDTVTSFGSEPFCLKCTQVKSSHRFQRKRQQKERNVTLRKEWEF